MWQIAPEDLTSAGNQDKIRELQVEDQIEDAEQEEEVQEAMERGLEAESHEVFTDAVLTSRDVWDLVLMMIQAVACISLSCVSVLLPCCLLACMHACRQNVLEMCFLQAHQVTLKPVIF